MREETHTSIQVQPEQPGIPCAVVWRLIPSSPRRRIPLASVAGGLKDCRNPVGSTFPPPAWHQQRVPGPHGFAVRFSASRPHVVLAHGPKPALRTRPRARRCRVHRNPPQRSWRWPTPLYRDGMARVV